VPIELSKIDARVLGCLLEKAATTPDQYPLTLNALTNACNQKSARDPVMSLDSGEVQRAIRSLEDKRIVRVEENFKTQVEKYSHRFCNTPFSDFEFDPAQYAIICVLLLRGARTPGELRANSGRLHTFAHNSEVTEALHGLCAGDNPTVVQIPRAPGRRDNEYVHLFFGDVDIETIREQTKQQAESGPVRTTTAELEQRVARLEEEVAALRQLLD